MMTRMSKFEHASIKGGGPTEAEIAAIVEQCKITRDDVLQAIADVSNDEIWLNDRYQVNLRRRHNLIHLSIKRIDKDAIHDWRDLQLIKNELVGPENEAIELYPAESRLVDSANQYHLWVHPDPSFRFPFGFNDRFVVDEMEGTNSRQRPFSGSEGN